MSSLSANTIIQRALTRARVISPGESIPSGKLNQAFDDLNDMLESWSLERLMVLATVIEDFTLTASTNSYTWGSGGDINTARPIALLGGCYVRSGSIDFPVETVNIKNYLGKGYKSSPGVPSIISLSPGYPLSTVYINPTPSDAYVITLHSSKEISSFADKTTAVSLAPGYSRAIISNLAVELSVSYGKKVSEVLAFSAAESKSNIKSANYKISPKVAASQFAALMGGGSGGNINNGPY